METSSAADLGTSTTASRTASFQSATSYTSVPRSTSSYSSPLRRAEDGFATEEEELNYYRRKFATLSATVVSARRSEHVWKQKYSALRQLFNNLSSQKVALTRSAEPGAEYDPEQLRQQSSIMEEEEGETNRCSAGGKSASAVVVTQPSIAIVGTTFEPAAVLVSSSGGISKKPSQPPVVHYLLRLELVRRTVGNGNENHVALVHTELSMLKKRFSDFVKLHEELRSEVEYRKEITDTNAAMPTAAALGSSYSGGSVRNGSIIKHGPTVNTVTSAGSASSPTYASMPALMHDRDGEDEVEEDVVKSDDGGEPVNTSMVSSSGVARQPQPSSSLQSEGVPVVLFQSNGGAGGGAKNRSFASSSGGGVTSTPSSSQRSISGGDSAHPSSLAEGLLLMNNNFYTISQTQLPVLPSKHKSLFVKTNHNPRLVFERRVQLDRYLKHIVAVPELLNTQAVRRFLFPPTPAKSNNLQDDNKDEIATNVEVGYGASSRSLRALSVTADSNAYASSYCGSSGPSSLVSSPKPATPGGNKRGFIPTSGSVGLNYAAGWASGSFNNANSPNNSARSTRRTLPPPEDDDERHE